MVLIIGGVSYWLYARQFESTDDAFIDARHYAGQSEGLGLRCRRSMSTATSSSTRATCSSSSIRRTSRFRLEQAKAQLENAKAQYRGVPGERNLTKATTGAASSRPARTSRRHRRMSINHALAANAQVRPRSRRRSGPSRTAQANLNQTRAQVPQAESDVRLAQVEYDRRQASFARGDISRQSLDQGLNALADGPGQSQRGKPHRSMPAQSRVDEAQANVAPRPRTRTVSPRPNKRLAVAGRRIAGPARGRQRGSGTGRRQRIVSRDRRRPQIAAAEAAVHQAEQDSRYTKIYRSRGRLRHAKDRRGRAARSDRHAADGDLAVGRYLGRREFQGNAAREHADRPEGRRSTSTPIRTRRSTATSRAFRRGRARGSRSAGRECDRQFRKGRPAGAGQDRL